MCYDGEVQENELPVQKNPCNPCGYLLLGRSAWPLTVTWPKNEPTHQNQVLANSDVYIIFLLVGGYLPYLGLAMVTNTRFSTCAAALGDPSYALLT